MPTTTCRRASTSRRDCSRSPMRPTLLRNELAKPGLRMRADGAGHEHRSRTSRSSANGGSRARSSRCSPECEHPFTIVTKSALVERDLDVIAPMAAKRMARVFVSITTLDKTLARTLEPRAAAPHRRLQAVAALAQAGVPTGVMVAPIIPQLNDKDLEAILEAASQAGATHAGWVILRLAAGGRAAVPRLARDASSAARAARDEPRAPDPRRARLRRDVRQAPDRQRRLRAAHPRSASRSRASDSA